MIRCRGIDTTRWFYHRMKTSTLITLSRRIDKSLTQFALAANPAGEYPWQTAQREKQTRRRVGGALVGGAAIGAGAYGAKKLNARYGTKGMDGMKVGAADLINRADDKLKAGYGKAKVMAGQGMDKLKGAAAPVLDPLKRKLAAGKVSYGRGVAQKQGAGKLIARVGRALIHASRADVLVELEAKLDGALQEFGFGLSAGMKMLRPKPSMLAPKASVGVLNPKAPSSMLAPKASVGVLNPKAPSSMLAPKASVGVLKPKGPTLPPKKRKFWGGRDVTDNPNFG